MHRDHQLEPVVIFDGIMLANQEYGGITRYIVELARGIAEEGRVTPVVHAPLYVSRHLESLKGSGVEVRGRRIPVFRGCSLMARTWNELQTISGDFQVYHSSWYPKRRPCEKSKLFAVSVYDMIAEIFSGEVSNAASQSIQKHAAIENADLIFSISEATKSDLMRIRGVPEEKIVVTPLGTSIGKYFATVTPLSGRDPFILYVGRRSGYKNFASLLRAFKASEKISSEFRLVCFGGEPFGSAELAQLSGLPRSGPGSVIRITGGDDLLAQLYSTAALYVCTSKYEGFGIPLLEAMTCGCPVVTTRYGSLAEVGGSAPCYADDHTDEALRTAIEAFLFDSAARAVSVQAGLKQAQRYSWKNTAKLTVDAYLRHIAR
jgi:glycosyltransferase involved in cell wall biosynthesis